MPFRAVPQPRFIIWDCTVASMTDAIFRYLNTKYAMTYLVTYAQLEDAFYKPTCASTTPTPTPTPTAAYAHALTPRSPSAPLSPSHASSTVPSQRRKGRSPSGARRARRSGSRSSSTSGLRKRLLIGPFRPPRSTSLAVWMSFRSTMCPCPSLSSPSRSAGLESAAPLLRLPPSVSLSTWPLLPCALESLHFVLSVHALLPRHDKRLS